MATEEWAETVRRRAESVRAMLDELWERIDRGPLDESPYDELDEIPLEIVWEMGEPFAVVLGTGGPHVEITGGGRQGGYVLHVYWSEHIELRGESITRTGEYFREVVDTL